eukprot:13316989-Alexandrium_andersonii.AAC.1
MEGDVPLAEGGPDVPKSGEATLSFILSIGQRGAGASLKSAQVLVGRHNAKLLRVPRDLELTSKFKEEPVFASLRARPSKKDGGFRLAHLVVYAEP